MRGGGKDLQIWRHPPKEAAREDQPPNNRRHHAARAAEGAEQHPRPLLAGEPAVASPSEAAASAPEALRTEAEQ